MSRRLKGLVSKHKRRFQQEGFDLDLTYICDRIIAMGFPAERIEGVYRNHIDDVVRFLQTRHAGHYKIYHLCSEREFDVDRFSGPVAKYPFGDHTPPRFEQMLRLAEDVQSFLSAHPLNVIAINCKAGKGRTGVMVCTSLLQTGVVMDANEALRLYAERRTDNAKGVTIASQRRYVHYFDRLIRWHHHPIGASSLPTCYLPYELYLTAIFITGLEDLPHGVVVELCILAHRDQLEAASSSSSNPVVPLNASTTFPSCQCMHCHNCSHQSAVPTSNNSDSSLEQESPSHCLDPMITLTRMRANRQQSLAFYPSLLVAGDICFKIVLKHAWPRRTSRFWCNTFFISPASSNNNNSNAARFNSSSSRLEHRPSLDSLSTSTKPITIERLQTTTSVGDNEADDTKQQLPSPQFTQPVTRTLLVPVDSRASSRSLSPQPKVFQSPALANPSTSSTTSSSLTDLDSFRSSPDLLNRGISLVSRSQTRYSARSPSNSSSRRRRGHCRYQQPQGRSSPSFHRQKSHQFRVKAGVGDFDKAAKALPPAFEMTLNFTCTKRSCCWAAQASSSSSSDTRKNFVDNCPLLPTQVTNLLTPTPTSSHDDDDETDDDEDSETETESECDDASCYCQDDDDSNGVTGQRPREIVIGNAASTSSSSVAMPTSPRSDLFFSRRPNLTSPPSQDTPYHPSLSPQQLSDKTSSSTSIKHYFFKHPRSWKHGSSVKSKSTQQHR